MNFAFPFRMTLFRKSERSIGHQNVVTTFGKTYNNMYMYVSKEFDSVQTLCFLLVKLCYPLLGEISSLSYNLIGIH